MNISKLIIRFIVVAVMVFISATTDAGNISSPSNNISVYISIVDGVPVYSVFYKGKTVIAPSKLGLKLADAPDFVNGFECINQSTSSFDETWQPVWGENSHIRNHYNELLFEMHQPSTERFMNVRFRVYDDGVGFRYEWP